MKRKDLSLIILTAVTAAFFSFIAAKLIFTPPVDQGVTVPELQGGIQGTFPDVKTDPKYNTFLNENARDFTQPIKIGKSKNNAPFNDSQ